MMDSHLPEFENPPISEVALSVEFLPLEKWRTPHAGVFWQSIVAEYPHVEVQPPLLSQVEKFGDEFWLRKPPRFLELSDNDQARVWLLADPGNRLIQIQQNRFIVNWRKVTGKEIYPRYENDLRPRFDREWKRFSDFVAERSLGPIEVTQCELTYVNDIAQGEGWNDFSDLPRLFAAWRGLMNAKFLPTPEQVSLTGAFVMPEQMGRLHFATQYVLRSIDSKHAIQLRLTARGRPKDGNVLEWMDVGREWIVRGFADLTTDEAHKLWKRRS